MIRSNRSLLLGSLLSLAGLIYACQSAEEKARSQGEKLTGEYCGSCHLPVSPALLDKTTWLKHVLPAMAPKLGIPVWGEDQYYPPEVNGRKGLLSFNEWTQIVEYYKREAPDSLQPARGEDAISNDLTLFSVVKPAWKDTNRVAATTMVAFDSYGRCIYTGDGGDNNLYAWDTAMRPSVQRSFNSPVVNVVMDRQQPVFTCIGTLRAIDARAGQVWRAPGDSAADAPWQLLADSLPRPVQSLPADVDKDGLQDWIVCGFGHDIGGLYYFRQTPGGRYQRNAIWEMPGAVRAVVNDFDGDGWPDIMALFAYSDEGVWLFLNDHKRGFKRRNLLRFPPVYGSTGFQVADFNKDGKPDILYTCGDNADYSMILKPFHGVYLFLNEGDFRFRQAFFYPVNGCTKAIAEDFDQDGDLDIAAIAFFADLLHQPDKKFVYLEQTGSLQFAPRTLPNFNDGRWICMDTADYDGDGDTDIILGNYSRGFLIQDSVQVSWNPNLPLVVLKNNRAH
jgi:hypothetical protein